MSAEKSNRGELTRAEIVRAAYLLFVTHGYNGTSMRQIAREAGVALGGIYNHFASKEELFLDVLIHHHPIHAILPLINAAQGETIEEFVRDAARRMVEGIEQRMEFLNLIFIELVEFKGVHLPRLIELFLPQLMQFSRRILDGNEHLRPIPPLVLVRAFIGFFFSYIMTELLVRDQFPKETMEGALDHFIDIFLHGILVSPQTVQE